MSDPRVVPASGQAAPPPYNKAAAARSVKWSAVEYGGMALISFATLIVYARYLSIVDFGLFSIVLAIYELLMVLVAMLFHDALVQRPEITERHYDTAFTATLVLSVLLTGLCALVAPMLASATGAADAAPMLLWMSLCLPFTAISATLVARRRRELDFKLLSVRSLVGRTAGAIVGVGLVMLEFAYWGLVVQHVLAVALGSIVIWARSADGPRLRFGMREFRDLIGFGVASVSALMLHHATKRWFIVASGLMLGTHAAGLLNLAFRAVDTLWLLAATPISQIALPVMASARSDPGRFRRGLESASAFACLTMYFAFVLLAATSPEVVQLLFGPQWRQISPYITFLALQVLLQARRPLFAPVLTSLGRPRDLLLCQGAELAFVAAALVLLGTPTVGWAIGIWVAREVVGSALETWMVGRATELGTGRLVGGMGVPLIAALAMLAAVSSLRPMLMDFPGAGARLSVLVPAGAAVYFGCVALLKWRLLRELTDFVRSAFRAQPRLSEEQA